MGPIEAAQTKLKRERNGIGSTTNHKPTDRENEREKEDPEQSFADPDLPNRVISFDSQLLGFRRKIDSIPKIRIMRLKLGTIFGK